MQSNTSATTSVLKLKNEHEAASYDNEEWITDGAWVPGLCGALAVLICGYWYYTSKALSQGVSLLGFELTSSRDNSILLATVIVALSMVLSELLRLFIRSPQNFIRYSPLVKNKQYKSFIKECVKAYLLNLLLLWAAIKIYGYLPRYNSWDLILNLIWYVYLYLGLPYTFVTRAFKYDSKLDLSDYPTLTSKILWTVASLAPPLKNKRPNFGYNEKKIALSLAIKFFFTPIMAGAFFSQFATMTANIGYLLDVVPQSIANGSYSHALFNKDFFNISKTFILAIDVALAWCGYTITSRWLDNQTESADPTLSGWVVCLINYPPFQILGLYFAYPSELAIFNFGSLWVITVFVFFAVICYFIYMLATLYFGIRFSNLTHRGVIRKGPYAIVRHPAYASKNISWWCVIMPAIIMNMGNTGYLNAFILALGLCVQSWLYYMRAITEERHLSQDPRYIDYCKHVKYRFIPGVI